MKLFIPGPTNVHPDVLAKMGTPMIGHRTPEASVLQKSISDKLRKLMYTENKIVLSTSSGTGLMEGAIRSITQKKAIVFATGSFGKRWHELAILNGIDADLHEEEKGNPILPETVDSYLKTGKYDTFKGVLKDNLHTGKFNLFAEVFGKAGENIFGYKYDETHAGMNKDNADSKIGKIAEKLATKELGLQ